MINKFVEYDFSKVAHLENILLPNLEDVLLKKKNKTIH